jgi:hypothetical protein
VKKLFSILILCLIPLSAQAFQLSNAADEFDMSRHDKRGHIVWSGITNTVALYGCEAMPSCSSKFSDLQVSGAVLVAWWLKGPTYDTWKANPTGTSLGDGLADFIGVFTSFSGKKVHRYFFPKSPVVVAPVVSRNRAMLIVMGGW